MTTSQLQLDRVGIQGEVRWDRQSTGRIRGLGLAVGLVDDDESVVLPETSHTLSHAQHLGNGHVRLRGARPELGIAYVGYDVAEDLSFDSDIRPFAQRKQLQILLDGLERDLDGHPSEVPVQHIVGILLYVGEEHEESILVRPPGLLLVRQGFELLPVLRTGQPFAETICRVVLVEVDVCVDPLVEDSDLSPDSEIMMTLSGEGILPVAEQVLRAFVELLKGYPRFAGILATIVLPPLRTASSTSKTSTISLHT